jgi:RND family efflux transporter MFP subunit
MWKKQMNRILIWMFVSVLLFGDACSQLSASRAERTPTPMPTDVSPTTATYIVKRGEITRKIDFSGRVVPQNQQPLSFVIGGRVGKINVGLDDQVKKGQILASLDNLEDLQRQQADGQLKLQRAQILLDIEKLRLDQIKWQTRKADSQTRTYEIGVQENQVKLAENALEETKLNSQDLTKSIEDAQIVAPIDGKIIILNNVVEKNVEAHEIVMVIGDLSQLEVSADLQNNQMQQLAEGMPLTASSEDHPGETMKGSIRRLPYPFGKGNDGQEDDSSVRVTLATDLAKEGFSLGDRILVTVILEHKDNVLLLTPQAIRTYGGRTFVLVQDGDIQKTVDVKLGVQNDDYVEILEGLTEGQVVISQ